MNSKDIYKLHGLLEQRKYILKVLDKLNKLTGERIYLHRQSPEVDNTIPVCELEFEDVAAITKSIEKRLSKVTNEILEMDHEFEFN